MTEDQLLESTIGYARTQLLCGWSRASIMHNVKETLGVWSYEWTMRPDKRTHIESAVQAYIDGWFDCAERGKEAGA